MREHFQRKTSKRSTSKRESLTRPTNSAVMIGEMHLHRCIAIAISSILGFQDLLALHDAPLAAHFGTYRGGLAGVVWPHLAALWTELLTRSDWLRVRASVRARPHASALSPRHAIGFHSSYPTCSRTICIL